jgi:hypothetical protein
MAKKRKGRLVPIKKTVFDPRIGKSIERTYYIEPNKVKPKKRQSSKNVESDSMSDSISKYAQYMVFCNW